MPGPVGILANAASGKDIRRLVAHASVFDNQEKQSIVRRAILGAIAAGADHFLYLDDHYGIVRSALDRVETEGVTFEAVESPDTGTGLDTRLVADQLRQRGCSVVITLGGDGTNRAAALAWRDLPVVAISTGTNNVFPRMVEATVAGSAAGLIASGAVSLEEVTRQAKAIRIEVEGGKDELALIDAVILHDRFVGARAIWEPATLRAALLTRAEPAAVGISAIGGLLQPVNTAADHGLLVEFGEGAGTVYAPIAPGLFRELAIARFEPAPFETPITWHGPGVLAFDGEREVVLKPGQSARLTIRRDGPRVIDVALTLQTAACRGAFRNLTSEETDGN